ncbi:MAG: phosphate/phosphite/phosphonate ABC transporter substrate-binding protein [Planctomycetes bacterium]|nr:phosphate/phosphite/phosphonate ABC transporter substrate-binding protein [Planctomycetota bacterium]MBM3992315.1 phosphate/phosphite/phosphonate ABC transporter substrate-binding protein [Planctomycetota bacterium]
MPHSIRLGAVAYDPKVVTIWDGFQAFFAAHGLAFDYVLYTNYERQVEQHFAGAFDVAWNSPLAWIETERVARARNTRASALAMRDTDCDLRSVIAVREEGPVRSLAHLAGKVVGVGAQDSPQATLIPLEHLAQHGLLAGRDFEVRRFDVLVGKHGDHVGGERLAAQALVRGEIDAACMIDGNHLAFSTDGSLPRASTRVLDRTGLFDHCNFTVLDGADAAPIARLRELLLGMRYDDAAVRPLMDLEGLKAWLPGRTSGYALLEQACDRSRWLAPFLRSMGAA